MTDKQRILLYMEEHGSITPWEAITEFGCTRLGARIWDLKKDGLSITSKMETGVDRHGEVCRYSRYYLNK